VEDLPRLVRVAHTLKGASAHISAPVVMEIAKEIEFAAREANLVKAAEAFPRLEIAFAAVEPVLRIPS
jgi:HPt (histidine-containing phosphotransfer) domain-containing protein